MGLVATAAWLVKLYVLFMGAWRTFKLLKTASYGAYDAAAGENLLRMWAVISGLQTYELYLEWAVAFWCPFYYEMKLGALVWLSYPGSGAPRALFDRLLDPAMRIAAFHAHRDLRPKLASAVLQVVRKLQAASLPALAGAVRRDELKMWDRSVRGQLALVQVELEKRRGDRDHLAGERVEDRAAAALLATRDGAEAQILRELLESSHVASANGGICGSYKRGQGSGGVSSRPGSRRASTASSTAAGAGEEQRTLTHGAGGSRVRFAADAEDSEAESHAASAAPNPTTMPKRTGPAGPGLPLGRAGSTASMTVKGPQAQAQAQAAAAAGIAMGGALPVAAVTPEAKRAVSGEGSSISSDGEWEAVVPPTLPHAGSAPVASRPSLPGRGSGALPVNLPLPGTAGAIDAGSGNSVTTPGGTHQVSMRRKHRSSMGRPDAGGVMPSPAVGAGAGGPVGKAQARIRSAAAMEGAPAGSPASTGTASPGSGSSASGVPGTKAGATSPSSTSSVGLAEALEPELDGE